MPTRLAAGTVLGRYRVEEMLAEGGMGVVYRARQVDLDLPVAIKVIRPEWAMDEEFRARFKREARIAASMHHPNVVSPHDFGDHEGRLYVVMPLIDGIDLGAVIDHDGPLDPARAAMLLEQVASALDVAHESGLVHRDVKPANVLLQRHEDRERALLTDFGVAKSLSSETGLTRLGQLPGTPGYVSPEQINGDALDGRTDVYSLGCVLCEALTGTIPYPRQTPAAMLIAHITDTPPRVTERVPGVPAGFDEVVGRALAKDPGERFASAGELAEAALDAASGTAAPPAPRAAAPEPAPAAPGSAPAVPAPPASPVVPGQPTTPVVPEAAATPAVPEPAAASVPADRRGGRSGLLHGPVAPVLALALTGLATSYIAAALAWSAIHDSDYSGTFGDRARILVVVSIIANAVLAIVVALLAGARRRIPIALAIAVAASVAGALLAAAPDPGSPRRWLVLVLVIGAVATALAATLACLPRRGVLLALVGAVAGALAGTLLVIAFYDKEDWLAVDGRGPFVATNLITGALVAAGVALPLALARRHRRPG